MLSKMMSFGWVCCSVNFTQMQQDRASDVTLNSDIVASGTGFHRAGKYYTVDVLAVNRAFF